MGGISLFANVGWACRLRDGFIACFSILMIRIYFQVKLKARHDSFGSSLNSNEGYFRFFISGQPIRLMLLSKDKQNLLKIISFDFLVVCMQVTRISGLHKQNGGHVSASLDDNIWEFEWKRLQKHPKKFLAPVILLGMSHVE